VGPGLLNADAERFLAEQQGVAFGQAAEWVQLAAIDRSHGGLCGDCAVRVIAEQPATAEIGVTLAQVPQGQGLATEALSAVVTRLFEDRGTHRVSAEADDRNRRVHGLLRRVGFRCEARLVEAEWFKGEWSTLRVDAILEREWRGRPDPAIRQGLARLPRRSSVRRRSSWRVIASHARRRSYRKRQA
jgi:RimJ/RimL family protein N-acetyltransferase